MTRHLARLALAAAAFCIVFFCAKYMSSVVYAPPIRDSVKMVRSDIGPYDDFTLTSTVSYRFPHFVITYTLSNPEKYLFRSIYTLEIPGVPPLIVRPGETKSASRKTLLPPIDSEVVASCVETNLIGSNNPSLAEAIKNERPGASFRGARSIDIYAPIY